MEVEKEQLSEYVDRLIKQQVVLQENIDRLNAHRKWVTELESWLAADLVDVVRWDEKFGGATRPICVVTLNIGIFRLALEQKLQHHKDEIQKIMDKKG